MSGQQKSYWIGNGVNQNNRSILPPMANPSTPPSYSRTREVEVLPTSPQYEIIASRQSVNLFLAGQGSGKTTAAGFISGILINTFPRAHGFIGANTYTQLSDSTLFRIRRVWKEIFGWTEYSKSNPSGNFVVDINPPAHFNTVEHDYDSYHGKICFRSGTVVYKGSLDNYKAHDGKEFAWAILDETKDTKEEAVKEVIVGRLREQGMWVDKDGNLCQNTAETPFNPLYIFTSPAKVPWINEWFRLDDYQDEIVKLIYSPTTYFCRKIDNKLAVISSSYHNQANLPANFIENQKANLHSALIDMLIYGNPFSQSGGEFYKCFDRMRHVKDVRKIPGFDDGVRAYNPRLALHASFDFNVNPYMTCTIWQIQGKKAYQIDEICLSNPNNTTPAVCRDLIRRYQGHTAGLFIYGDPSGKQEDTRSEKGSNDFTLIMKALQQFRPTKRVSEAAPSVTMRGNWINTIFEKGHEGIEIIIHEGCKNSIADYTYLKEASDGTKLKEKAKNSDTQVTYEKWGHTSDSSEYFLCFAFMAEFNRYQSGGLGGAPRTGRVPSKSGY